VICLWLIASHLVLPKHHCKTANLIDNALNFLELLTTMQCPLRKWEKLVADLRKRGGSIELKLIVFLLEPTSFLGPGSGVTHFA
jgi:hypothetical protein